MNSSRTEGPGTGPATGAPTAAAPTVDVTMPQMGVSVAEGTVVAWRVEVGDRIEAEETICEISTDKIDTEVPAPASGTVSEILVPVEMTVSVGEVLARISTDGGRAAELTPPAGANGAPPASAPGDQRRYSPVVQRIAAEHGLDLSQVPGTGRGGRVRKQDVLAFLESGAATAEPPSGTAEPPLHIESPYRPAAAQAHSAEGAPSAELAAPPAGLAAPSTEAVSPGGLSRVRRQIGEHMKRSLDTAAHCTTWIEVDMSRIEAARAQLGLTALPFVARATIAALREHPALNATLEDERYTRHERVNLGIAVSLGDDGLIVPVIHDAHELSAEGLAARIKELARRARAGQLAPDEVRRGTFTITNPGQYGSIMATPIINQPQVAILDLEAVNKHPVVVTDSEGNDAIAVRPTTILGLSWDHRALDGAQAAQFLASVKRHLEERTGA